MKHRRFVTRLSSGNDYRLLLWAEIWHGLCKKSLFHVFWFTMIYAIWWFDLSPIHSVDFSPPVVTSFLSDGRHTERLLWEKKSPEVHLSFPLLCSRMFFRWIWEKTREASPPCKLLRTRLPSSHILSFVSFGCFLKVRCMHTHKCVYTGDHYVHKSISRACQNHNKQCQIWTKKHFS